MKAPHKGLSPVLMHTLEFLFSWLKPTLEGTWEFGRVVARGVGEHGRHAWWRKCCWEVRRVKDKAFGECHLGLGLH